MSMENNPVQGKSVTEWLIPVAAVALVFVMLVPVPAILLDILLALSITVGVLVLLASLYILRPVQFSVFPTLLLLLTLFRISLNIASSRRILLHGSEGVAAAGTVIQAFGQFVVGGNYVVGFVIFLALIAIQYLVINHGAVRTAEVAARFTLDALPGKQMAIDAELNAGLINEHQARPPRNHRQGSRILRRHGRCRAFQPARCPGDDSHHGDQHHCRISDRGVPAQHPAGRGGQNLYGADGG
jgi:flagellar biosynthesis protein FlhA